MLEPKSSRQSDPEIDNLTKPELVQQEFERLEEIIFQSSRLPLTRWTILDEERLLERLKFLRMNWPDAFEKAVEIIEQKQEIIDQAEDYAQEILESAQKQAAQILDEVGIVQQAQLEASQIRQQVQQECEALQEQTIAEIEEMRAKAIEEIEQMRQLTVAECDEIQNGADDYAEEVLGNIEDKLSQMLRVVRNGRRQLSSDRPTRNFHDGN
ncbi:MAG: hypothetical protein QNJ54_21000 [Prochloraceae cyanobacterium]|nr:hypothetical protein [Prochloraceae cyanobacterium]